MSDKYYCVSKETLELILYHANEMLDVATFLQKEYNNDCNDLRKEVISDGVGLRLDAHHNEINKIVKLICNNGKINKIKKDVVVGDVDVS